MSGTRGGLGRIVAMGVALALALLLLAAREATAGKYEVAQCGWYVGADASWADTTGGAKFRSDGWCVPPPGADPFDGVHLKSFTRDGQDTVSGTRFARWRWETPSDTDGITAVRGTWWHALHDGMEQRLGGVNWGGTFNPSLSAAGTDTALRDFAIGFNSPIPAFEDRLLCARGEDKWCSLDPGSWSGLRALTLTVEDDRQPAALLTGGDLVAGGWRRGTQSVFVGGDDGGSGIRSGETFLDGNRVGFTEYQCNQVSIGGEWRATTMRPCGTSARATHYVDTNAFSDGPHTVVHCTADFAGNGACTGDHHVLVDNNPPAHPRNLALAGGDGWRRVDDFDLSWQDPDQGPGSPIGGALWRIVGPAGFDTGVHFSPGRDLASLSDMTAPGPGEYALQIWLRDEAGNDSPASALTMPLRLDNVAPGVAFAVDPDPGVPEQLRADVTDAHSGPAAGAIFFRRLDSQAWLELPTKVQPGSTADARRLVAEMPPVGPGTYVFRADAADVAGNTASTTRRADGTEMAVRKVPPPPAPREAKAPPPPPRAKTRIFARLLHGRRLAADVTVPYGSGATVTGRLVRADGDGIPNRELSVISRPSRGALDGPRIETATTGPSGGFRLDLAAGTSRRVSIDYPGDATLEGSSRPSLLLRVRAGLSLRAAPRSLRTGEVLRFSGVVHAAGAPVPRRGKLVAIQYLEAATHRWRPVLVTRSDHSGRFHARYRFRYVTGAARIRLRAVALAEERWPYAPGASRALTVRVRGR